MALVALPQILASCTLVEANSEELDSATPVP